jgi:hypothetical protein
MSKLSFNAFCIEMYAERSGIPSPKVFGMFRYSGLLGGHQGTEMNQNGKSSLRGGKKGSSPGSALIWAMVTSVILLILISVMAVVVQAAYHRQRASQIETQAYYTARSVNERISNWLDGTPRTEEPEEPVAIPPPILTNNRNL